MHNATLTRVAICLKGEHIFTTWIRNYSKGKIYMTNGWVFSKSTTRKLPYAAQCEGFTFSKLESAQ